MNTYIDINKKQIDLDKLDLNELNDLNFQEETYFAKEIKKRKPFTKERNDYLNESYKKIMQIAEFKRKFTKKSGNGVDHNSIIMVKNIVKKYKQNNKDVLFYEAGVGTGYLLKFLAREGINIKGCDVFLQDSAKRLDGRYNRISLIQNNLYDALDEIKDNSIDIFYADNVLEHITDDEYDETIKKISNKIKKDGIAIIIIPNSYVGPNDATKFKLPPGSKCIGFHFMEQTFNQVINSFKKYNLECSDLCIKKRNNKIILIPHAKLLNIIKKSLENKLGNIKNIGKRKRIFNLLAYNTYILRKK